MANPIKKARLDPEHQEQFNKLSARLGLTDTFGEDSEVMRKAVVLANKHLDLKDKLKELFGGIL